MLKNNTSEVIGIQFGLLSPEEIKKGSVAEITSRDTYINNKPVVGGLFDPRMGVLEPGLICPTDGLDYISSPGYFGHIELAKPVYYYQYLPTVMKVLKCVCFKCSKLLISKKKYVSLLKNERGETRWTKVYNLASKAKHCGENVDGCGCGYKQPSKIKKENIATLVAEWDDVKKEDEEEGVNSNILRMPVELVLKILSRISHEDLNFMGFSSTFSNPAWMICKVLAVPPPAVRPSIKHDSQQRSEDDISHTIVNIIKANNTLKAKLKDNAPMNIVDDWTNMLQYFVATLIDNKIPGIGPVAQRSGRPLKAIKERLSGKGGRVRGNLMGKRVDFSARSVITPDPNLSITQLGIPLKIAKNITKPIVVNKKNYNYLMKLIDNGPTTYPGANVLQKQSGDTISLKYVDLKSIKLEIGDVVHRHLIDGDAVLFNRQPTLHRMSMMCHIAKVLLVGDTFRMNVGDTKPYNADFDGDEMNMHMPQNIVAELELKNIAAVANQIISPAQNNPIVGIFQDSLLGSYRLTNRTDKFNKLKCMNLLSYLNVLDINLLENQLKENKNMLNGHDILSHILLNVSLKYKTSKFKEGDNFETSKNVLEINNGKFIRGVLDKKILGGATSGLIHRIFNDNGNLHARDFIDNLQNIVTNFMHVDGYSVGISDLISNKETDKKIKTLLDKHKLDVDSLINNTHLSVFKNLTGRSNHEEFENQVNKILNDAGSEAGKIGRQSLSQDNRFVIMVNAGSKGSDLNISQMISCLGQVSVDGKRIPYGFDNRTLPHYNKFDDSPVARGFVENSFIKGLSPQELFFHAMGGRVGLIDTAVKTSQTGYIQRRLIKGMEDLKVGYDLTVRNNKNKIVQFIYGDDNFDTSKIENQKLPLIQMTIDDIYEYYSFKLDDNTKLVFTPAKINEMKSKKYTETYNKWFESIVETMINNRDNIIKHVFDYSNDDKIYSPISFVHIIENNKNQFNNQNLLVDLTLLEAYKQIEFTYYEILNKICNIENNQLFKTLYFYFLNPKVLLVKKRFNKKSLTVLLEQIVYYFKKSLVMPGEMVGILSAQSIGEPTTQMTLNTFHLAGVASKSNVTRGVPRVEELLSLSDNPKNPSMTVFLKNNDSKNREKCQMVLNMIEETKLRELVDKVQICFEPNEFSSNIVDDIKFVEEFNNFEDMIQQFTGDEDHEEKVEKNNEKSKWIIRLTMNNFSLIQKNITLDDIDYCLKTIYNDDISTVYSNYNDDNLIFRISVKKIKQSVKTQQSLDQSDEICYVKNFSEQLLNNINIRGIKNISKVLLRKEPGLIEYKDGKYESLQIWVLDTVGSNLLDTLALDYIDVNKTYTNSVTEMYKTLGIEAARQSIYNEFLEITEKDGTYINRHHLGLLTDRMTYSHKMISIFRHGINNDDIGVIAKASFEETPEMFLKAARHAELDKMHGISANVMCGQLGFYGTNSFQLLVDHTKYADEPVDDGVEDNSDILNDLTKINTDEYCSLSNMQVNQHAKNISKVQIDNTIIDNSYDLDF